MTQDNTRALTPRRDAAEDAMGALMEMVVDSVDSPHSKRAYKDALEAFWAWFRDEDIHSINKATVQRYKAHLEAKGLAPSTVNQRLSAIRKMAGEAADNGLMPSELANGISRVKGIRSAGVRTGNWLTKEQAQDLLVLPDANTIKGLRDRAVLALLLGTGLRRAEVARLTFGHIQQREGRWAIVDMRGKGNRIRTVPVPSWAKAAVDAWADAAGITEGRVFRSMRKGNRIVGDEISPQAVRDMVAFYTRRLDLERIAPHDLRRTFAHLAHKGGAPLDQIQLSLGHASIKTTEDYLGIQQDLADAPCDRLGLKL